MSRLLRLARRRIRAGAVEEPPPPASINATLSGSVWYLQRAGSVTRTVTLTRTAYTDPVSIAITGLPSGVTATITPSTLTGSTLVASIQLSASSEAALATTAVTVTLSGSGVDAVMLYSSVTVAVLAAYGPGPNAPAWVSKTVYPDERFTVPIPTSGQNAAGFRGFNGFWAPPGMEIRATYVEQATPLGAKNVLRSTYPGQTEFLSALNATTTPRPFWDDNQQEAYTLSVRTFGTWVGRLVFEESADDGDTWSPIDLRAGFISGGTHVSGISTTINGLWCTRPLSGDTKLLRVRLSEYVSGQVEVRVGMKGGGAAADFGAGGFDEGHTRFYSRIVHRQSENWTDGGNTGTKGLFFLQQGHPIPEQRTNHFMYQSLDGLALQGNSPNSYVRTVPLPAGYGDWLDCEQIIEIGTPGGNDGTAQLWVNGVKVIDATGIPFVPSLQPAELTGIYVNPTYGGGENPPPYDIFLEYAYFYRESAP